MISRIPVWRRYLYGFLVLLGSVYIGWSIWWPTPQKPSAGFQVAKPAVPTAKVPGPVVKVPIKIVPKAAVKDKFPEAHVDDPDEEVIDTADIGDAPNGATTVTTLNTITGESKTEVKIKEAPWFAFEHGNTAGVGYEVGTQGSKVPIYYRRDILRIKDLHLVGEVGGKIALSPAQQSEVHGAGLVEMRW